MNKFSVKHPVNIQISSCLFNVLFLRVCLNWDPNKSHIWSVLDLFFKALNLLSGYQFGGDFVPQGTIGNVWEHF